MKYYHEPMHWYILDDEHQVVETSMMEHMKWLWKNMQELHVNQTELPDVRVLVSTVFLGFPTVDGRFFETMIFGGEYDGYKRTYKTWDEAAQGHIETMEMIFGIVN